MVLYFARCVCVCELARVAQHAQSDSPMCCNLAPFREMEHIAIEVQQLCPRRVMLQSVEVTTCVPVLACMYTHNLANTTSMCTHTHTQWGHFKDGFPNLFLRNVRHLWRHDTAFLTSMHDPTVLFEQVSSTESAVTSVAIV